MFLVVVVRRVADVEVEDAVVEGVVVVILVVVV